MTPWSYFTQIMEVRSWPSFVEETIGHFEVASFLILKVCIGDL
jgi:hypothetical protein